MGACLAGTLALSLFVWARFPVGGPGGGTSGASFGVLGAAIFLGLKAGGGYRRFALTGLAITVLILSWMYDTDGIAAHVLAMVAGASFTWLLLTRWRPWRPWRPYRRGALPA